MDQVNKMWKDAHDKFQREVDHIQPLDISSIMMEDALEQAQAKAEAYLKSQGVAEGCRCGRCSHFIVCARAHACENSIVIVVLCACSRCVCVCV